MFSATKRPTDVILSVFIYFFTYFPCQVDRFFQNEYIYIYMNVRRIYGRFHSSHKSVPVNPGAQLHLCSLMSCSQHVPPFWQGLESHAFDMGISHRDAVNPNGHWHEKPGCE